MHHSASFEHVVHILRKREPKGEGEREREEREKARKRVKEREKEKPPSPPVVRECPLNFFVVGSVYTTSVPHHSSGPRPHL